MISDWSGTARAPALPARATAHPAARHEAGLTHVESLEAALAGLGPIGAGPALRRLCKDHHDRLPLPGQGRTLLRWQALSAVAAHDPVLARLFEGHVNALAVLADVGAPVSRGGGVWAFCGAEDAAADISVLEGPDGACLAGRTRLGLGAAEADQALLKAHDGDRHQWWVSVALDQPRVERRHEAPDRAFLPLPVLLHHAPARPIARAEPWLAGPGPWRIAAGQAASWYGAACGVARRVRDELDADHCAGAGAVDAALHQMAELLRRAASALDGGAGAHRELALRLRAAVSRGALDIWREQQRRVSAGEASVSHLLRERLAQLQGLARPETPRAELEVLGRLVKRYGSDAWRL